MEIFSNFEPNGDIERVVHRLAKHRNGIDSISAVEWMKETGSRNFRQTEWIGFFFEQVVNIEFPHLIPNSSESRYGNTQFDLFFPGVGDGDLKARTVNTPNGSTRKSGKLL